MKSAIHYDLILRSASLALLAFTGFAACFGGGLLIADPTGGNLGLQVSMLEGTPFTDYLVPGFLLFMIIGVGNLIAAGTVLRAVPWFPFLMAAEGCSLTVWIIVQMLMIQIVAPQQFIIGAIGLVLIGLGILQWETSQRT